MCRLGAILLTVVSLAGAGCARGDKGADPQQKALSLPVRVPGPAPQPLVVYTPESIPEPGPVRARVTGLALTPSDIYFVDNAKGVQRVSVEGATPETLVVPDRPLVLPAVSPAGDRVYLLGDEGIASISTRPGSTLSVAADELVVPRGLAITRRYAFVTTGQWLGNNAGSPDGVIVRVGLVDGERVDIAAEQAGPISVAADDQYVYWTCKGAVMRSSAVGDDAQVLAAFGEEYPWHIALSDTDVYVAVQSNTNVQLYRVGKTDGTTEHLANIAEMPASLAVVDSAVYFIAASSTRGAATLWRLETRVPDLHAVATGLIESCCVAADHERVAWNSGDEVFWLEHGTSAAKRVRAR